MSDFAPPSPPYLGPASKSSGGSNKPIKRIVLHGTVSPTVKGGARDIARYFRSPSAGGSAHYVTDPDEAVQVVFDSVIAWHAPPNGNSLGVEMCDWVGALPNRSTPLPLSRWDDKPHTAMLKVTARLVAQLCLAYDVPVRMVGPTSLKLGRKGICEHSDVSVAFRQSSHWDLGNFPRRRFLRMVRAQVKVIKDADKPIVPQPKEPTRITRVRDIIDAAIDLASARKQTRRAKRLQAALDELPKR